MHIHGGDLRSSNEAPWRWSCSLGDRQGIKAAGMLCMSSSWCRLAVTAYPINQFHGLPSSCTLDWELQAPCGRHRIFDVPQAVHIRWKARGVRIIASSGCVDVRLGGAELDLVASAGRLPHWTARRHTKPGPAPPRPSVQVRRMPSALRPAVGVVDAVDHRSRKEIGSEPRPRVGRGKPTRLFFWGPVQSAMGPVQSAERPRAGTLDLPNT